MDCVKKTVHKNRVVGTRRVFKGRPRESAGPPRLVRATSHQSRQSRRHRRRPSITNNILRKTRTRYPQENIISFHITTRSIQKTPQRNPPRPKILSRRRSIQLCKSPSPTLDPIPRQENIPRIGPRSGLPTFNHARRPSRPQTRKSPDPQGKLT